MTVQFDDIGRAIFKQKHITGSRFKKWIVLLRVKAIATQKLICRAIQ